MPKEKEMKDRGGQDNTIPTAKATLTQTTKMKKNKTDIPRHNPGGFIPSNHTGLEVFSNLSDGLATHWFRG